MKVIHAELTSTGPARANNEDWVAFWEPDDPEEYQTRGASRRSPTASAAMAKAKSPANWRSKLPFGTSSKSNPIHRHASH